MRTSAAQTLDELTLEAPLILAEAGAVQLQLTVGEPDGDGRRAVAIHSRPEAPEEDVEELKWTRHAAGSVSDAEPDADAATEFAAQQWPPEGAEPIDTEALYDRLAELGFNYGPVFQGVTAAWRRGEELFAELSLDESQIEAADRYGIHPALFDAALHLAAAERFEPGTPMLPFAWTGARLHSRGASRLRVRLRAADEQTLTVDATDETGAAALSLESLRARPVDMAQLAAADAGPGRDSLFTLEWGEVAAGGGNGTGADLVTIGEPQDGGPAQAFADPGALGEAIETGLPAPAAAVADLPAGGGVREGLLDVLALLKEWLEDQRLLDTRLALVTRGAVAAREDEVPDPAMAAVWGLVRSAASEHPGRLLIVDADGGEVPWGALLELGEPQLAVRDGKLLAPRLARAQSIAEHEPAAIDPDGTVLITGGTGALGGVLARHLASRRGVRHLLLASRRGPAADTAEALVADLASLGCEAYVAACDVTDRAALAELIDSIPGEHPLTAVIHAAGVLDDATVLTLEPDQIDRVLGPKVDAAVHLHELTAELDLAEFILFSSAAATLGAPGQGNYAAANAFLDALAQRRRADGLPARSLAWGLWEAEGGMGGRLGEAGIARLGRLGVGTLRADDGLELLEAARRVPAAVVVPIRLELAALRAQARADMLPPIFRGLVRVPARAEGDGGRSLTRRLASIPQKNWDAAVLDLVQAEVADVLGYPSPGAVDAKAPFKDLGFDSLAAIELRNRLIRLTGINLPATLVFDHPTTAAAAGFIRSQVGDVEPEQPAIDTELDRLESMLRSIADDERQRVGDRLRSLATSLVAAGAKGLTRERIESASAEEIFELIDSELRGD